MVVGSRRSSEGHLEIAISKHVNTTRCCNCREYPCPGIEFESAVEVRSTILRELRFLVSVVPTDFNSFCYVAVVFGSSRGIPKTMWSHPDQFGTYSVLREILYVDMWGNAR